MGNSPRLADVFPRRNVTYLFMLISGFTAILFFGGLHFLGQRLAGLTTDGKIAAFDLDSEGSIASWFSIVLLFVCALASLVVGRLRVAQDCTQFESLGWRSVALLWLTMSIDEGASLHEAFKELMTRMTGTRILGDGSIYWAVPYTVLLLSAGLFLLWAARRSLPALACLAGAGISYAVAVVAQLEWLLQNRPSIETWIEESCEMLGGLFILLTLVLYARSDGFQIEQPTIAETSSRDEEQNGAVENVRRDAVSMNRIPNPHVSPLPKATST